MDFKLIHKNIKYYNRRGGRQKIFENEEKLICLLNWVWLNVWIHRNFRNNFDFEIFHCCSSVNVSLMLLFLPEKCSCLFRKPSLNVGIIIRFFQLVLCPYNLMAEENGGKFSTEIWTTRIFCKLFALVISFSVFYTHIRGTVLCVCFILYYCGVNERRWSRFPNFQASLPAPVFLETHICISTPSLYHLPILSSPSSSHYHHPPSLLFGCVNVWVCYVCKMKTLLRLYSNCLIHRHILRVCVILLLSRNDRSTSPTWHVKHRVIYTYMLIYSYWRKTFRLQRKTTSEKRIVFRIG